ncbi:MAG: 4'-phosphopantetheinyl transferase family protein [Marinomonas colpomeniae]
MNNQIRIFFTSTEDLSNELQQRIFNTLPTLQKNKVAKTRSQKRQKEFIVGRALLIQALLGEKKIQNLPPILEKEFEAPTVYGLEDCYVSISHCKDLVCCVLHTGPVGIDVEYKKNIENMIDKSDFFMHHEELVKLQAMPESSQRLNYFYETWCAKEAIFKSFDRATQKQTSLKTIQLSILLRERQYSLFNREINNYHVSLVCQGMYSSVQLTSVDLESYLLNFET